MPINADQTLVDALQEGFLSFTGCDERSKGRELFLRYYKREGEKFLRAELGEELLNKKVGDLNFQDISKLLAAFSGTVSNRMQSNQYANISSLIVNGAACGVSLLTGFLAFFGYENGGCNIDARGKFTEAFQQQPIPAIIAGDLAFAANAVLDYRRLANREFSVIAVDMIAEITVQLLAAKLEGMDQSLKESLGENEQLNQSLLNLTEAKKALQKNKSLSSFVHICDLLAIALRTVVISAKAAEVIYSGQSPCDTDEPFTSYKFNAITLFATNIAFLAVSGANYLNEAAQKENFESQMKELEKIVNLFKQNLHLTGDEKFEFQDLSDALEKAKRNIANNFEEVDLEAQNPQDQERRKGIWERIKFNLAGWDVKYLQNIMNLFEKYFGKEILEPKIRQQEEVARLPEIRAFVINPAFIGETNIDELEEPADVFVDAPEEPPENVVLTIAGAATRAVDDNSKIKERG